MELKDFKLGQTAWLRVIPESDIFRSLRSLGKDRQILEAEITGVNKKYISVKYSDEVCGSCKFKVEDSFRQYYTHGGEELELYNSLETLQDYLESEKIYKELKQLFSENNNNNKIPLEVLKVVYRELNYEI